MSIGIDFILRANSAGFTQGVARANNSIKDFKKSLREGDVGHGLKQMFGAGAVIAGMRAVINHAQEARDALEGMGKSVPETTAQIAGMADALDGLKKGAMSAGTTVLGFFTDVGSKLGDTINTWLQESGLRKGIDPKLGASIEREADRIEAAANAKKKKQFEANSVDNLIKLSNDLEATRKANDTAEMGRLEKLAQLRADEQALIEKGLKLRQSKGFNGQVDQAAVLANSIALEKKTGERAAAEKGAANMHDKYMMTTEQLSNATVTEGMDPAKRKAIMDARQAMQLEAQANQLGFAGDMSGSDLAMAKANKLRQGLSGFVKSDEVNKDKDFAAPIVDQLKELNGKVTKGVLVY